MHCSKDIIGAVHVRNSVCTVRDTVLSIAHNCTPQTRASRPRPLTPPAVARSCLSTYWRQRSTSVRAFAVRPSRERAPFRTLYSLTRPRNTWHTARAERATRVDLSDELRFICCVGAVRRGSDRPADELPTAASPPPRGRRFMRAWCAWCRSLVSSLR